MYHIFHNYVTSETPPTELPTQTTPFYLCSMMSKNWPYREIAPHVGV